MSEGFELGLDGGAFRGTGGGGVEEESALEEVAEEDGLMVSEAVKGPRRRCARGA